MSDTATENRLNVLVTDGSYKHALGIVRSLGRRGHRVNVIGSRRFSPAFFSRYTNGSSLCPDPLTSPAEFTDCLTQRIRDWRIQLVIPVGYSSVDACAMNAEQLRDTGVFILIPSAAQFADTSDKWQMIATARSAGLSVPESCLPDSLDDARAFLRTCNGRGVAKLRRESLGKGATLITSESQLNTLFAQPGEFQFGSVILQNFVNGHGSGYMALAQDGHVVREFAHRRLREMPASGGYSTAAESIRDPALIDHGRQLFEAMAWTGPGMVECRVDGDRLWFIEFNPKFWGSLDLALHCGADFPGDLCLLAGGNDLTARPMPEYRVGDRAWWPWRGDVRRLWQRPGDVFHLIGDLLSPRARSNWRWTDPTPNLIEIGGELTFGLRRRHKKHRR
ncbi:MAG: hypothetical protein GF341_05760 [candidate division Zixibacteria bacterium]|nr:hypothetical protein [candidate division Zixibacteria bacterium]